MCALFGWLNCGGVLPHKVLKKFTQELANAAEERGTDASGISYVSKGRISIYKKPKSAHKVKFNFPENTTAIMGHTPGVVSLKKIYDGLNISLTSGISPKVAQERLRHANYQITMDIYSHVLQKVEKKRLTKLMLLCLTRLVCKKIWNLLT